MSKRSDIEFFFDEPTTLPGSHKREGDKYSVLYLLRREVQECLHSIRKYHPERDLMRRTPSRRLFASAMVIFAGVDLLAKFYQGEDNGGTGVRFRSFAKYLGLNSYQRKALWRCRNAVMHSFGLCVTIIKNRKVIRRERIIIRQDCKKASCGVTQKEGRRWSLCLKHLYSRFVQSVEDYQSQLLSDGNLRVNFKRMFPHYGFMKVQDEP